MDQCIVFSSKPIALEHIIAESRIICLFYQNRTFFPYERKVLSPIRLIKKFKLQKAGRSFGILYISPRKTGKKGKFVTIQARGNIY